MKEDFKLSFFVDKQYDREVRAMEQKTGKNCRFELDGRTMIICPGEDLDHHNAVYIREMADGYLEKYPINRVIFDFTGVEFMDSSGIGVIMGRYKQMCYVGGEIYVRGIGRAVERIFQMSGLYKLVKRWEEREEK